MSEPLPVPQLIAGRYRVLGELGRGGMGVVYRVEHVHTRGHFALKILLAWSAASGAALERLRREARATAAIRSEHVVRIVDADAAPELNAAPFLVMELLRGQNLEQRAANGPLSPSEVVATLSQVGRALDKAHALGIVHRDLKPENIFLHEADGSTIVKLLDFGISKTIAGDGGASITQTGAIIGTPAYMAPEQARAVPELIGPPTDIWAIGMTAYYLLTGEHYFRGSTPLAIVLEVHSGAMPPPSTRHRQLGASFDAWFARSCHRDPRHRWASVGQQVEALERALFRPAKCPAKPRWPLIAMVIVLMGLVGALMVLIRIYQPLEVITPVPLPVPTRPTIDQPLPPPRPIPSSVHIRRKRGHAPRFEPASP